MLSQCNMLFHLLHRPQRVNKRFISRYFYKHLKWKNTESKNNLRNLILGRDNAKMGDFQKVHP